MSVLKPRISLDDFHETLQATAITHGLTVDFLMKRWNGRFATYNIGIPTAGGSDQRRGVRDEPRSYRLLGRVKANTLSDQLVVTLNPPTSCDLTPSAEEQGVWDRFAASMSARLV